MINSEKNKSCCLWLFIAVLIGAGIGIKPGMLYQELLGDRQEKSDLHMQEMNNVNVTGPQFNHSLTVTKGAPHVH